MASPAFVYAFDNLGPDRFVELCGLLLGARYKGLLLGGEGPDGGVDGETAPMFAELRPESSAVIADHVLPSSSLVVFQFKHKVAARVGQAATRSQLLGQYNSTPARRSEVCKPGVLARHPDAYVLVTNVEVNSNFRMSFAEVCRRENPEVATYEVIGLDELEMWVTLERNLRSQFFPTIFGAPRFDLRVKLVVGRFDPVVGGRVMPGGGEILNVTVQNVGSATSYLSDIKFRNIVAGSTRYLMPMPFAPAEIDPMRNPEFGQALEPGRCEEFRYPFNLFREAEGGSMFLVEVIVRDQIGNLYTAEITDEVRAAIFPTTTERE